MSFYQDNTAEFYLGEGRPSWNFKDYAENIGKLLVLYVSEDPIDMHKITASTTAEDKHLIASRLIHVEIVDDPKEKTRVVYLLIFESGLQVIINSNKTNRNMSIHFYISQTFFW